MIYIRGKAITGVLLAAVLLTIPIAAFAVTSTADDVYRAPLYKDGSISCSGADDISVQGGEVVVLPQPGEVEFKVKLRNAQPDTAYSLAVSEEATCAAPVYYSAQTTDSNGDADFYGSYKTTAGSHNLLFDLGASGGTTNPRDREIGTQDFNIVVPAL
jgi:hypothetical protein